MRIKQSKKNGYTLVELLVAIGIIVLLTTFGVVSYSNSLKYSRDQKRKANLSEIANAIEVYKSQKGSYPTTGGVYFGTCSAFGSKSDTGPGGYVPDLAPAYINKLPHDPLEGKSVYPCYNSTANCYLYQSDGVNYKLWSYCGPEETVSSGDKFYDPKMNASANGCSPPDRVAVYAIWSSGTSRCW